MTQQETPERLTREEKKARTRAQLIDAAAAVFARRGYVAASLDEVAEEAGLTKGAVYSNFDRKEDLFQAVIEERLNEPMKDIAEVIDTSIGTTEEQAMAGARAFVGVVEQEQEVFLLALEMNIHVARHPELEGGLRGSVSRADGRGRRASSPSTPIHRGTRCRSRRIKWQSRYKPCHRASRCTRWSTLGLCLPIFSAA